MKKLNQYSRGKNMKNCLIDRGKKEPKRKQNGPRIVLKWRHTIIRMMESANKWRNREERKEGQAVDGKWKVREMHSTARSVLLCAFSKRPPPTIVPGRQWPDEPVLSNLLNSAAMKGARGSCVRSLRASTCLLELDEIALVRKPLPSKYLSRHFVPSIEQLLIERRHP